MLPPHDPLIRRLLAYFWPLLALIFFAFGLMIFTAGLRNSWAPPSMVNPAAVPSDPANPA